MPSGGRSSTPSGVRPVHPDSFATVLQEREDRGRGNRETQQPPHSDRACRRNRGPPLVAQSQLDEEPDGIESGRQQHESCHPNVTGQQNEGGEHGNAHAPPTTRIVHRAVNRHEQPREPTRRTGGRESVPQCHKSRHGAHQAATAAAQYDTLQQRRGRPTSRFRSSSTAARRSRPR